MAEVHGNRTHGLRPTFVSLTFGNQGVLDWRGLGPCLTHALARLHETWRRCTGIEPTGWARRSLRSLLGIRECWIDAALGHVSHTRLRACMRHGGGARESNPPSTPLSAPRLVLKTRPVTRPDPPPRRSLAVVQRRSRATSVELPSKSKRGGRLGAAKKVNSVRLF